MTKWRLDDDFKRADEQPPVGDWSPIHDTGLEIVSDDHDKTRDAELDREYDDEEEDHPWRTLLEAPSIRREGEE